MPLLLSLPREIRDQIIEDVVRFRKEPPKDPTFDAELRQDATDTNALRPPTLSPKIYNAFGLLGTNLQLRSEIQYRLQQLKIPYSLDVMIVDNELWPNWTCCPSRASGSIDEVTVSLRFFSKPNDPFIVHVARTCRAILQGRKWTSASLHPLAEIFLYIRDVCLAPGSQKLNRIRTVRFDIITMGRIDQISDSAPLGTLSDTGLRSLFGKHRSLWNSFRSIHQYSFAGKEDTRRLGLVSSLRIMVLLMLQEAWEDECAIYAGYVGKMGDSFRSVHSVEFCVDGKNLEQLASRIIQQ